MENKKPYYYWRGEPLTKFEYIMLRHEIIADYLIEDAIEKSNCEEAKVVLDKIKKSSYNRDK
jgi:hypothetical protein